MGRSLGGRMDRTGSILCVSLIAGAASLATGTLAGCSVAPATPPCNLTEVMTPASAIADHAAAPPGNSVTFSVGYQDPQPGSKCVVPLIVYLPTLTTSDPVNVALSTAGVATCVGATTVPAILTDTRSNATATLTCK